MIEYVNYKGHRYFLNQGITKKGTPKYFFSKDIKAKVDEIPIGYEIYENPHGLVFLRKITPQIITDEEINIVKSYIPEGINSKVDVKNLAKRYCIHLGKDSFYELYYFCQP